MGSLVASAPQQAHEASAGILPLLGPRLSDQEPVRVFFIRPTEISSHAPQCSRACTVSTGLDHFLPSGTYKNVFFLPTPCGP